jgi:enamine deaminase RidA (YjgF/YER057c/UK114 family)
MPVPSMRPPAGLHLDYLSPAEYRAARWADVLGVATFNGAPTGTAASEAPVARVHMAVLSGEADVCEVWRCGEPVESGHFERVSFRRSEDMLFGCIAVPEGGQAAVPRISGVDAAGSTLHEATSQAYHEICAALDTLGYPHLLRVWNYLPDINVESGGLERYRQFNSARQHVLRERGRALTGSVPAASALGAARGSPLLVYFLAGRTPARFVENPRQVSAYHYPRQYGPHSPVFSRAALVRQGGTLALFISGTASIVGHRSTHVGDTAAQTRETLTNIEALLAQANATAGVRCFDIGSLVCKVYVRRPEDLAVVQAELMPALAAGARCLYLQADICREDLLVEIEAAAIRPTADAADAARAACR